MCPIEFPLGIIAESQLWVNLLKRQQQRFREQLAYAIGEWADFVRNNHGFSFYFFNLYTPTGIYCGSQMPQGMPF